MHACCFPRTYATMLACPCSCLLYIQLKHAHIYSHGHTAFEADCLLITLHHVEVDVVQSNLNKLYTQSSKTNNRMKPFLLSSSLPAAAAHAVVVVVAAISIVVLSATSMMPVAAVEHTFVV